MERADRRLNEYLADHVRANAEGAPAPAASSSSGGAQASGLAAQVPEEVGASGATAGQGGPASAGVPPAGPPESRDDG
eukprot:5239905-Alexandrium_andersonii.AAC.1